MRPKGRRAGGRVLSGKCRGCSGIGSGGGRTVRGGLQNFKVLERTREEKFRVKAKDKINLERKTSSFSNNRLKWAKRVGQVKRGFGIAEFGKGGASIDQGKGLLNISG